MFKGSRFVAALASLGLVLTGAACSSDSTTDDGPSESRSIEHKLGTTRVPVDPERIVTIGYSDQDTLLAFGDKPVGVVDWYGDYPDATWPWAQDALGDAHPEVFNRGQFTGEANIDFEGIAALAPDLIMAQYIDVSQDAYDRLTEIAPTVTTSPDYPDFGMPWQENVRLVGETLGETEKATDLIDGVDSALREQRAAHPEFEGKTAAVVEAGDPGTFWVRSPNDGRSRLLTSLGFVIPQQIIDLAGDSDAFEISTEQLGMLDLDVLVWNTGSSEGASDQIKVIPTYQTLNVAKDGRDVFVDDPIVSGAMTWGTVLSLPYAIDALVPPLSAAASK
ncbi:iron-siderophore ABC transporter substrate-binding protein [Rhodococcoides yunnanense]|uniref:iron-siderophore ABC transporter substrate-binding protein n=1 Tax=Rhodococcoides yunnanense TaxID=278209 RepID=UPI000932AB53|nr:iron-siderophore ABC transporter substrate-binding protein [Rhodococcus yunnanensis]